MTIWTVLHQWAPFVHVWWIEPQLKSAPPTDETIESLTKALLSQTDGSRAASAAESIATAETARLDYLERKLDAQRTILTAILPFSVILLGWSARDHSAPGGAAAAVSITYIMLAYLIAARGSSASERYLLSADRLRSMAGAPNLGAAVAATRVEYSIANQNYGVRLANYIWATQRMAIIAATAFGCGAAAMFLAGSVP